MAKVKVKPAEEKTEHKRPPVFSPQMIGAIAEEVSKTLVTRLPGMLMRPRKKSKPKKAKKIESAIFLDTSAIIDGRIFDVIYLGLLNGTIVLTSSILLELKHLADSQDTVKRERGRKGLESMEKLRKSRKMKVVILQEEETDPSTRSGRGKQYTEVDEKLIKATKEHKGKVITCDYNLEKKATIEGVTAVNINALSNALKVIAVPGEALHVKLSHVGKEIAQGVGYLDDGTMIVVEEAREQVGKSLDVVVARVIQTATGRILFAKKI
ncbi:MAG TPA: PIN domain-containing protein [Candidatus Limnocylindrales bacterium]|nr:PIN domain-containing protein [Candidatus Limnocylindrales bacterium]